MIASRRVAHRWLMGVLVLILPALSMVALALRPESTLEQRQHFAALIEQSPRHFVAQPVQELSTLPCWREGRLRRCSVDLRPFVVFGDQPSCLPGALTRVALVPESKVVNLSQGGGYKDTWLLSA
jgi:uncharacterized circularly permuted ATP-grasp superfamily protein